MRTRFFKWLAGIITRRNKTVLGLCALMTIAMFLASLRMGMRNQITDMMPKGVPQVEELNAIIDDYSSTSTVMIAVESSAKNKQRMQQAAEEIAARLDTLVKIKPRPDQKMSLGQRLAVLSGKFPVKGVIYDTLPLVKRIDYKADNDFISRHGMMAQKTKDLRNMLDMYNSFELPGLFANINNNFEKEFVNDAENLASLDGETQAVQGLEGMYRFVQSIGDYVSTGSDSLMHGAVRDFVTGPEYFYSSDNSMLLIMLQPTMDWNNLDDAMTLGYMVLDTLKAINRSYPDLYLGASGWMVLQIDETEAIKKDFGWPSLLALLFILILLVGSFRTWKNPFFSVVTLVIGIIWVAGILAIVLHYLNMMSASFGIVLIGLGIDFGIHFISGFSDGRDSGLSVEDSIFYMFEKVGHGVITGGLTTAIVFATLALVRFKALTEMGVAVGVGIVTTLIAMMVLLPALIVWDNKDYSVMGTFLRKLKLGFLTSAWSALWTGIYRFFSLRIFFWITELFQFRWLAWFGHLMNYKPAAALSLILSAGLVYLSIRGSRKIEFEYDMMEMEPLGIPSVIVQDKILEKFELSPDYALMKADNLEDCRAKIKEIKKAGSRTGLIGGIDGISEFIPEARDQEKNIPLIEAFRNDVADRSVPAEFGSSDLKTLKQELVRLHQNIVEMGELSVSGSGVNNKILRKCDQIAGKKDEESKILAVSQRLKESETVLNSLKAFQSSLAVIMKERLLKMSSTERITLETLPPALKDRYANARNDDLLITVFPKSNIWEGKTLRKFQEVTEKISPKITGTPAITLIFIDLVKEKGREALLFAVLAIFLFLLLDFRSLKYTIGALIPLLVGSAWMLGIISLLGMKFNYTNFMALPLILGIGIDDGVHILHRYKLEGKFSMPIVLKHTGRAILLTSLTTMIGFGSMGLASHRGIASMGQVLFIGVGTCFLSSVLVLPALVTLLERGKKEIESKEANQSKG